MRCVCLLLQDLTSGIQMDDCVLVDFGLWRTYFAEPQSSTGAINRFKEMTAPRRMSEVSLEALSYPEPFRVEICKREQHI